MTSPKPNRVSPNAGSDLPTGIVTWTTLLARWTALVKAGEGLVLAAPDDADARRWQASIPEVVALQAITFALGDLEAVEVADRSIARDRADLAVTESCGRLDTVWRGVDMPSGLLEVSADARRAVELSVYSGLQWVVNEGSEPWRMPPIDLEAGPSGGTLALMQPGTLALPGSPVAWWTEGTLPDPLRSSLESDGGPLRCRPGPPIQVYRELDEQGRVVQDVVETLDRLPAGLPLLVPIRLDGAAIGRFTVDPEGWADANDAALAGLDPMPRVLFGDLEEESAGEPGSAGSAPE